MMKLLGGQLLLQGVETVVVAVVVMVVVVVIGIVVSVVARLLVVAFQK